MKSETLFKKNGFTFIELLIAITIFTIIATAIYSSLSAGIRVWNRSNQAIEEFQSMRVFFVMVSSDLRNAVVVEPEKPNFSGGPAKMTFMTIITASGKEQMAGTELAKVIYYLDSRTKSITRRVARKSEGFDLDKAKAVSILTDINQKDFVFEYCCKAADNKAGYEWKDEWEHNSKIPFGVRITVLGFTRYIFIPIGNVKQEEKK